jgi:hypothetical protein
LLGAFFSASNAGEKEKTLCPAEAEVMFSCETTKHKIISLCAIENQKNAAIQ